MYDESKIEYTKKLFLLKKRATILFIVTFVVFVVFALYAYRPGIAAEYKTALPDIIAGITYAIFGTFSLVSLIAAIVSHVKLKTIGGNNLPDKPRVITLSISITILIFYIISLSGLYYSYLKTSVNDGLTPSVNVSIIILAILLVLFTKIDNRVKLLTIIVMTALFWMSVYPIVILAISAVLFMVFLIKNKQ